MIPQQLPIVSAMVGAGGTLGALIATRLCYMTTEDDLAGFRYHAVYVLFWALTCFLMRWEDMGHMFGGAKQRDSKSKEQSAEKADEKERTQTAPNAQATPAKEET